MEIKNVSGEEPNIFIENSDVSEISSITGRCQFSASDENWEDIPNIQNLEICVNTQEVANIVEPFLSKMGGCVIVLWNSDGKKSFYSFGTLNEPPLFEPQLESDSNPQKKERPSSENLTSESAEKTSVSKKTTFNADEQVLTSDKLISKMKNTSKQIPDLDSLYEMGSLTKTMTGVLLADMVLRGEIALSDPVEDYLRQIQGFPNDLNLRFPDGSPITVLSLAQHRSGLPRMPENFGQQTPFVEDEPYLNYTREHLIQFLSDFSKKTEEKMKAVKNNHLETSLIQTETSEVQKEEPAVLPKYEYSNLGFAVLGLVLEQASGQSYDQLIRDRLFAPLEMNDSFLQLDEKQRIRAAIPMTEAGQKTSYWNLCLFTPAGAVSSTARDMSRYISFHLKALQSAPDSFETPALVQLAAAVQLACSPVFLNKKDKNHNKDLKNNLELNKKSNTNQSLETDFLQENSSQEKLNVGLGWHFQEEHLNLQSLPSADHSKKVKQSNADCQTDSEREKVPSEAVKLWFHSGGTGGFRTLILMMPEKNTAVFIAANTTGGAPEQIGHQLLQILLQKKQ